MTTIPTKEELAGAWRDDTDDFLDFLSVHRESDDDWRHGSSITEVFKRLSDNTFWAVYYQKSGDGEYNGMREGEFEFNQVTPVEVVTTRYDVVK